MALPPIRYYNPYKGGFDVLDPTNLDIGQLVVPKTKAVFELRPNPLPKPEYSLVSGPTRDRPTFMQKAAEEGLFFLPMSFETNPSNQPKVPDFSVNPLGTEAFEAAAESLKPKKEQPSSSINESLQEYYRSNSHPQKSQQTDLPKKAQQANEYQQAAQQQACTSHHSATPSLPQMGTGLAEAQAAHHSNRAFLQRGIKWGITYVYESPEESSTTAKEKDPKDRRVDDKKSTDQMAQIEKKQAEKAAAMTPQERRKKEDIGMGQEQPKSSGEAISHSGGHFYSWFLEAEQKRLIEKQKQALDSVRSAEKDGVVLSLTKDQKDQLKKIEQDLVKAGIIPNPEINLLENKIEELSLSEASQGSGNKNAKTGGDDSKINKMKAAGKKAQEGAKKKFEEMTAKPALRDATAQNLGEVLVDFVVDSNRDGKAVLDLAMTTGTETVKGVVVETVYEGAKSGAAEYGKNLPGINVCTRVWNAATIVFSAKDCKQALTQIGDQVLLDGAIDVASAGAATTTVALIATTVPGAGPVLAIPGATPFTTGVLTGAYKKLLKTGKVVFYDGGKAIVGYFAPVSNPVPKPKPVFNRFQILNQAAPAFKESQTVIGHSVFRFSQRLSQAAGKVANQTPAFKAATSVSPYGKATIGAFYLNALKG